MKKQTGFAKEKYKSFEDKINVTNNNREDDVKAEVGVKTKDGKIIYNLSRNYFSDK